eukprot:4786968-Pleurochrysis_carterae.AAC.1
MKRVGDPRVLPCATDDVSGVDEHQRAAEREGRDSSGDGHDRSIVAVNIEFVREDLALVKSCFSPLATLAACDAGRPQRAWVYVSWFSAAGHAKKPHDVHLIWPPPDAASSKLKRGFAVSGTRGGCCSCSARPHFCTGTPARNACLRATQAFGVLLVIMPPDAAAASTFLLQTTALPDCPIFRITVSVSAFIQQNFCRTYSQQIAIDAARSTDGTSADTKARKGIDAPL